MVGADALTVRTVDQLRQRAERLQVTNAAAVGRVEGASAAERIRGLRGPGCHANEDEGWVHNVTQRGQTDASQATTRQSWSSAKAVGPPASR